MGRIEPRDTSGDPRVSNYQERLVCGQYQTAFATLSGNISWDAAFESCEHEQKRREVRMIIMKRQDDTKKVLLEVLPEDTLYSRAPTECCLAKIDTIELLNRAA